MNVARSISQIAAGTYLECYRVSTTNAFGKFPRLPLIIYHPRTPSRVTPRLRLVRIWNAKTFLSLILLERLYAYP